MDPDSDPPRSYRESGVELAMHIHYTNMDFKGWRFRPLPLKTYIMSVKVVRPSLGFTQRTRIPFQVTPGEPEHFENEFFGIRLLIKQTFEIGELDSGQFLALLAGFFAMAKLAGIFVDGIALHVMKK